MALVPVVIHSWDSSVNPYLANRARARSCWRVLRVYVPGPDACAGAVVGVVAAGAGVLVVAGAAGTAVEVLGVAVVAVEGSDVLLELPLLKTVPSLFIYFPMLFLRSAGPSDVPGADELMLMVVVEVLGCYPGMWC